MAKQSPRKVAPHPFDAVDLCSWPGAENYPDGSHPVLAAGDTLGGLGYLILVDPKGVELTLTDPNDEDEEERAYALTLRTDDQQEALAVAGYYQVMLKRSKATNYREAQPALRVLSRSIEDLQSLG